jgi:hypothetical protein
LGFSGQVDLLVPREPHSEQEPEPLCITIYYNEIDFFFYVMASRIIKSEYYFRKLIQSKYYFGRFIQSKYFQQATKIGIFIGSIKGMDDCYGKYEDEDNPLIYSFKCIGNICKWGMYGGIYGAFGSMLLPPLLIGLGVKELYDNHIK